MSLYYLGDKPVIWLVNFLFLCSAEKKFLSLDVILNF